MFRTKRIPKIFILVLLGIVVVIVYNNLTVRKRSLNNQNENLKTKVFTNQTHVTNRIPIIHRMNAYEIRPRTEHMDTGEYKCIIKHGSKQVADADLSLFSELDVHHYKTPPPKGRQQLWAFYSKEPQIIIKYPDMQRKWDGLFNYSATFNRHSEGSYHIFRPELMKISPPLAAHYKPKPNMRQLRALWFVSHCTKGPNNKLRIFSARESYALELSKYMTIDVYTSADKDECAKKLGHLIKDTDSSEPNMDDYMFYLSFENNLCKDYITEKLWKVLESNSTTIPIALGGLSIEDYEYVAPPNSFIHVKNFTSPEALAKHLKFVSEDDNAFHYYNQWRNEYWLKTRHVYNKGSSYLYHGDFFGYFCKLAHERLHRVWDTFSEDYGKHQCVDVSDVKAHCSYYNLTCNHKDELQLVK